MITILQCCDLAGKVIKCSCNANVTTNYDFGIADIICHAFIFVTGIIVGGFLVWKLIEYIAKGIAGWRKRVWEVEDIKRKQNKDLLDKKMQILNDLCYDNKDKDAKKTIKSHNSEEIKKYLDAIDNALSKNSTNKQPATNENEESQHN